MNSVVSTLRMPVEMDNWLSERARKAYTSKAAIVRQAVSEFRSPGLQAQCPPEEYPQEAYVAALLDQWPRRRLLCGCCGGLASGGTLDLRWCAICFQGDHDWARLAALKFQHQCETDSTRETTSLDMVAQGIRKEWAPLLLLAHMWAHGKDSFFERDMVAALGLGDVVSAAVRHWAAQGIGVRRYIDREASFTFSGEWLSRAEGHISLAILTERGLL